MEPSRFYCAECGDLAAIVALRAPSDQKPDWDDFGPDQWKLEVDGPVRTSHWILGDIGRVEAALRDGSIAALRAINPEYANFWCSLCAAVYCGVHWKPIETVFDEGFYDATYGTCPRGHRVMLDD